MTIDMKRLVCYLILLAATLIPAALPAGELPKHPRLIMTAGEEDFIKSKMEEPGREYLQIMHKLIMKEARATLKKPCQERTDTYGHILAKVRNVEKMVLCLSYAYRMTGDRAYAERAEKEIINACGYRDWDPAHYLDTAEMIIALSIGYDWLYGVLAQDTKEMVEEAVLDKGLRTAGDHAFYTVGHNWNQVCNCAMVIGSLAIHESIPEEADAYIKKSLESNPAAMKAYSPDGAYPEGNTYWGYGTSYEILMIEALRSALGSDFDIPKAEGFMKTGYYIKYLATPTGRCFSFNDSNTSQIAHMMTFWFASELGDPTICHLEKRMLMEGKVKECDRWWPCAMTILARAGQEKDEFKPDDIMFARGINPLWIYRSGWNSSDDTYLAVKGGNPCNNHGHVDNGSFYFERKGVLWAADLGSQSYGTCYKYNINLSDRSQDGQRWSVFRIGPASHNILIMNGGNPLVHAYAQISDHWDGSNGKGCTIDLTQTYSPYVQSATRSINLSPDDSVLSICDTLDCGQEGVDVVWNMVTFAKPEIVNKHKIRLKSGDRCMILSTGRQYSAHPFILPAGTDNPWDSENTGASRVGFNLHLKKGRQAAIKVTLQDSL